MSNPGWQTEELQDEWVDLDPDDDDASIDNLSHSISFTAPLASHIYTNGDLESQLSLSSPHPDPVGTFVVHQGVAAAPLLPRTPGRMKKGVIKDFFSPLPLERMFEPPSPPYNPNPVQLSPSPPHDDSLQRPKRDEIAESNTPATPPADGRKESMTCQFTFKAPRSSSLHPNSGNRGLPQAQSTPVPRITPNAAQKTSDTPLRLFQFQYDTFTRDHLSAMVDSIAVNTPSGSGSTPSPTSFNHVLSRVSEVTGSNTSFSHLRSTKRVKLSPPSDYGEGGISISRPRIYGKEYVGASHSLMQQIRQARDFSTISTVATAQQHSPDLDQQESNLIENDKGH